MDQERLSILRETINTLKGSVTKTEFNSAFKVIKDFVKGAKEVTERQLEKALSIIDRAVRDLEKNNNENLYAIQKDVKSSLDKALKEQADSLNFIRDKVRKIKEGIDGKDGKTPTRQELIDLILPLIPEPVKALEETAEQTRDKLETLKDDERLDWKAVKGVVGIHVGQEPPKDNTMLWIDTNY